MFEIDRDWVIRQHAFAFLDRLMMQHGDLLPWKLLQDGFEYEGSRITLIGQRGIWSPAGWSSPISITTSPNDPYGDEAGTDGLLRYRYYKTDPGHRDNVGLRRLMNEGRPVIYFRGVAKGWYTAMWPMVIVGDEPEALTFTMACDDVETLVPGIREDVADEARRKYVTRLALVRLHQGAFRHKVLTAYDTKCTVCQIRHRELLDAAHIIGDRDESGDPIIQNGLSLCKIHHAAFDSNIMGISPDFKVEIRHDILQEVDGPMLRHGLQDLHGRLISLPSKATDKPDPARLEERFERFRAAG